MMRNKTLLLLTLILFNFQSAIYSQKSIVKTLNWTQNNENPETASFRNAQFSGPFGLPYFTGMLKTSSFGTAKFNVLSYESEPTSKLDIPDHLLSNAPQITSQTIQERNGFQIAYAFLPFIKKSGRLERITQIEFTYQFTPQPTTSMRGGPEFKNSSVLKDGDIYKVGISKSGIYKINKSFFDENDIPVTQFDPRRIQIFGNPGGMNPEANRLFRNDDLIENAIYIEGESDGSFDQGDFILFYAHGPHAYENFEYRHNIYDDQNYYFIKLGSEEGKRVSLRSNEISSEYHTNYDAYTRYEKDEYNLLADFQSTQGSGKMWFSDKLRSGGEIDLSAFFTDANIDISEPVSFEIQAAGRSNTASRLSFLVDGVAQSLSFNGVSTSKIETTYADLEKESFSINLNQKNPSVRLSYQNAAGDAEAWLDYILMEYKSKLVYENAPIIFRSREDLAGSVYGYEIENITNDLQVWDVTFPEGVRRQAFDGNLFAYSSTGHHEFVVFDPGTVNSKPNFIGPVENQNLHGINNADLIILYHENFKEAAENLARHRADHSDLNTVAVPVSQVYNEFSSGRVDVPGIRNFARMLYLRDPGFRFLSIIGDGSYDYKHRDEFNDENFVPVYETQNSLHPINAFPTDDFYALLDEHEGDNLVGGLDIAVGRIPARTAREANIVVDKILRYETDPVTMKEWRLRVGFAADDEDGNIHLRDSDFIAEKTRRKYESFNFEKIYFDAFPQVSTPGGERYPQATEALYNNLFKGMLTLCYLGHGGPKGWAQERVLKREDVAGWNNTNKLPLMITATCSFTGFDSPAETSAGETILFEENGGAIGLMSTVRAVFVNRNKELTESVFDTIFSKVDGDYLGIGEILRRAKNSNHNDTVNVNSRKFLLIGDPALKLAIPKFNIITSSINGVTIDNDYVPDTIGALQKMSFEGYVADGNGDVLEDFNGIVNASVFDKVIQAKTLQNNSSSREQEFNLQKTVLFKGQSKVENGRFAFEFYLPSDINFKYGKGKISLYASNDEVDAAGYFNDFYIGGSNEGVEDDNPPLVDVFLNDEDFVFGGISNSEPILLIKLEDDFGINVAGVSVGHDLTAELDNNSKELYILNDFYEADLNDSRKGTVRFPLKDIEPGKHTLKVKAWDLSNNPGEGYTEFIVVDDLGSTLEHVFNYPNPFSTRTLFQFEHNLPGTELEILIHIYNMSGQIVKTIENIQIDDGFRIDDIEWDGLDDYGQKIANGVYLYKINVYANQLGIKKESNFEKLVILK
ncbi:type IX secretion system sortase PorU [Portibacter marinus]|uniref:type IX secretion system sortase PorU n=1 Tax=Portibacter marinus TaxID=2898660 RepID=UPI001F26461B|nr:type IX secretion system sortase PorU [Portibacter marinus]